MTDTVTKVEIRAFQELVWDFYRNHARDLDWRHDPSPYQVFVSEVMLQQTQVARVQVKYPEWMARFPDFESLAGASVGDVVTAWQGMGYNRRALWLQRAARMIVDDFDGQLPQDPAVLVTLPGIGVNTAGSIVAFAYDAPVVFIETNIRRVFIHHFFPEDEGKSEPVADAQLLPLIEAALDRESPREWYYALMDYGSALAKTVPNPNRRSKHYVTQSKFEGSLRQIRGQVLKSLSEGPRTTRQLGIADDRLDAVLEAMTREGFIVNHDETYCLAE